jgi:hypothetical protein
MARKKKTKFQLDPEWIFKEPLDFEFNKYTLLDYLQKCEKKFENLEIYPDFVELSLHLANIQSISKENVLLLTDKNFESCDDEILMKELYPKKPREITKEEEVELDKTLKFSGNKLFDAFNIAKSIWNIAYDNVHVVLRKNKPNLVGGIGYIYYYDRLIENLYVWEFHIKKVKGDTVNNRTILKKIYEGEHNDTGKHHDYPIFEMKVEQRFPMEPTIIPIMKRKIMAYVFQVVNLEKIKNFDSES